MHLYDISLLQEQLSPLGRTNYQVWIFPALADADGSTRVHQYQGTRVPVRYILIKMSKRYIGEIKTSIHTGNMRINGLSFFIEGSRCRTRFSGSIKILLSPKVLARYLANSYRAAKY